MRDLQYNTLSKCLEQAGGFCFLSSKRREELYQAVWGAGGGGCWAQTASEMMPVNFSPMELLWCLLVVGNLLWLTAGQNATCYDVGYRRHSFSRKLEKAVQLHRGFIKVAGNRCAASATLDGCTVKRREAIWGSARSLLDSFSKHHHSPLTPHFCLWISGVLWISQDGQGWIGLLHWKGAFEGSE